MRFVCRVYSSYTIATVSQGHPYMESLRENKSLLYSLLATGGLVMSLAMGIIPGFAEQFEIVDFQPQVLYLQYLQVLVNDYNTINMFIRFNDSMYGIY